MKRSKSFALVLSALAATVAHGVPITIVSEQDLAQSWLHAPGVTLVTAGYPKTADGQSRDVCVNLGFLIGPDGSTSNFTQMKAWTSDRSAAKSGADLQPYVQTAAAAVSAWKFVPAKGKPRSVYTSATFAFAGSKALSPEQIQQNCRIEHLKAFVMQARQTDGRLSDAEKEREDRRSIQGMSNTGY